MHFVPLLLHVDGGAAVPLEEVLLREPVALLVEWKFLQLGLNDGVTLLGVGLPNE